MNDGLLFFILIITYLFGLFSGIHLTIWKRNKKKKQKITGEKK